MRSRVFICTMFCCALLLGVLFHLRDRGFHPDGRVPEPSAISIVSADSGSLHNTLEFSSAVPFYRYRIVNVYPHDPTAFTQGLVFDEGLLYESTGRYGDSSLRKVELETGKVLKAYELPKEYFGEGLTLWEDSLIQLTWQSGVGFVYEKKTFAKQKEHKYGTEGWGLTHDGKSLIMSDGSAVLHFLDPVTFSETRQIEVRDQGAPIIFLNELEYINGEIFANIWRRDIIARISPETGEVLGWIDFRNLRQELGSNRSIDVLNGIAYDHLHGRLFVTGKLWPKLFEIELVPW